MADFSLYHYVLSMLKQALNQYDLCQLKYLSDREALEQINPILLETKREIEKSQ